MFFKECKLFGQCYLRWSIPSVRDKCLNFNRCFSVTRKTLDESKTPADAPGFFSRIMGGSGGPSIEPMKGSHSAMLADKELVYELTTHTVKPSASEEYVEKFGQYVDTVQKKLENVELLGSWQVIVGNQDQQIHLWKHIEGYKTTDRVMEVTLSDKQLSAQYHDLGKLCRARENTLLLPFSFWGEPMARNGNAIYEMRSYILKPGTMIEWGNNWARGISYRRDFNQDVGGFFSQVGQLYMVYHFWAYDSLSTRKKIREETWRKPGWDSNVAYTVPLIKFMRSTIMVPNSYSQLK